MAWISVHEQVIGGKLRNLAKEISCSQNEALGLLIRFWLWGINNADKDGLIGWADKKDVAEILNIGIDDRYDSEKVVDALIAANWIDMEEGLYIHDWAEWQEQWYKAIQVRERDAARKREERRKKRVAAGNKVFDVSTVEETGTEKGMEEILPMPKLIYPSDNAKKSDKIEEKYPERGFKEFWEIYPRKVGKGEAYSKYKARVKSGWKPEELLEAAKNYASKIARERTESKYIKHPSTFLSATEPFVDYLPSKKEYDSVAVSEHDEENPYVGWE